MDNPLSQTTIVKTRWGLGSKLAVVGLPFLMAALLSSVATLWVSWQLDGGAAARELDLLRELDEMAFTIPEIDETVRAVHRPLVVITSNNEKELPDAFLRRCFLPRGRGGKPCF
jgi:hypothetical protein